MERYDLISTVFSPTTTYQSIGQVPYNGKYVLYDDAMQAVKEEREACAEIAKQKSGHCTPCGSNCCNCAYEINEEISAREA